MNDKDKDNPFGSTPPDNPFGSTPSDNPFGSPPPSDPFGGSAPPPSAPPPPADPGQDAWRAAPAPGDPFAAPPDAARPRADGAIPALILGIIGIAFCPLCAPFAWVLGRQAEQKVDASGGMLSGRGEATAGKVLGIVSCALSVLAILLFIALVVVGSSISAP
ncbi:MAG: hypothetical protein QOE31_1683 [Solirubrobacteraceae bacterium]|jgi:hypothetical protein|nr:hypothetical protein [Solirubrobacteraceae bacterium]